MSTSTPPEESTSHEHRRHDSSNTPAGATQTVLSILEKATSREGRPDSTPVSTVLGTAQNMLHRITSSSSSTPHAHATPSPEALLDTAASAAPTVLGAAQNVFSKLTHHATPHATPAPQAQILGSDVPREQPVEASSPTEGLQRVADLTAQGQAPRSVSSRGGGSGEERADTPPRGVAHVTRSYPALPDATHPPRPIRVSRVHRRPTNTYADSEMAWHAPDDRDTHRERSVGQRVDPTISAARAEFFKATHKAQLTGWAQNIAIALQVLIGALTTALGAALSGKKTSSVAISMLGGASTLVASYLARTKGTNEPEASKYRARALDHFLREIEAFDLDHGHEMGNKWDEKISGFRLGLERILGNNPGSVTVNAEGTNPSGEKWGACVDSNVGLNGNGNGKYPMNTKTGFMTV